MPTDLDNIKNVTFTTTDQGATVDITGVPLGFLKSVLCHASLYLYASRADDSVRLVALVNSPELGASQYDIDSAKETVEWNATQHALLRVFEGELEQVIYGTPSKREYQYKDMEQLKSMVGVCIDTENRDADNPSLTKDYTDVNAQAAAIARMRIVMIETIRRLAFASATGFRMLRELVLNGRLSGMNTNSSVREQLILVRAHVDTMLELCDEFDTIPTDAKLAPTESIWEKAL